ncbi:MAG: hypothetical protein HW400_590 [Candidatus Levybacteria bacterium]|nr:hypothetical protein [Candidatus Levybacteria bacterium]
MYRKYHADILSFVILLIDPRVKFESRISKFEANSDNQNYFGFRILVFGFSLIIWRMKLRWEERGF